MNIKKALPVIAIFLLQLFFLINSIFAGGLIVDPANLYNWGYRLYTTGNKKQTEWEKSTFGQAKISYQKIKSVKQVPGWPNTYYRFTITEEFYTSEDRAKQRLKNLYKIPPNTITKKRPDLLLRKGFRKRRIVYIVSTDVAMFEVNELPRVFQLLELFINRRNKMGRK